MFREFFTSESLPKIWHNYGFDRHMVANMYETLDSLTGRAAGAAPVAGFAGEARC